MNAASHTHQKIPYANDAVDLRHNDMRIMQRIHDVLRICKQPVKERYDPAVVLRDHDKVGHDADKKDEYRNCKDQLFHHVLIQSGRLLQGVYFRRSLVHNWSGCVLRKLPDIYVLLALFFPL